MRAVVLQMLSNEKSDSQSFSVELMTMAMHLPLSRGEKMVNGMDEKSYVHEEEWVGRMQVSFAQRFHNYSGVTQNDMKIQQDAVIKEIWQVRVKEKRVQRQLMFQAC